MPATLCSERGWKRTPINPVFFAPTDIQPGGLTEELQERLRASRNLIVICSPNSAQSEWVGKEIEFFHHLGRTKQIHFFIVDGEPHSGNPDTECFNPIVKTLGLPEILGANIHERIYRWPWLNRERAYVQLISKLLGVEFDAIWQRHRRLLIQRAIAWGVGIVAIVMALAGVWLTNQPVDVRMSLSETSVHNAQLPLLKNAVLTMTLDNETKTDTIRALNGGVMFTNIPHRFLGKPVRMTIACRDYVDVDTTVTLTKDVVLDICREPSVYGNVYFRLWDSEKEKPIPHVEMEVAGHRVQSDEKGRVILSIPLEEQRRAYPIVSSAVHLIDSSVIVPCGEDDIIRAQAGSQQ